MINLIFFIKKLLKIALKVIVTFIKIIFRKKNIILFQSYNKNRYCDNTRYIFEHLSKNTNLKVYWVSENLLIQKYLKKKNLKFISIKSNFIFYIYAYSTAKIIINPGTNYFDPYQIISPDVIKISVSHGIGPKLTITHTEDIYNSKKEIAEINKFDFINYTTDFVAVKSGIENFKIPKNKIIKLGLPRCDQFFNNDEVNNKYKKKLISKSLINYIDNNSKVIYYSPTWRPYDYKFPLNLMKDFEYKEFDEFLIHNNIFFFYTLHSERILLDIPKNLKNIKLIDTNKMPLFDTNLFMNEVDILVNDYSTTSTDYCLLSRPQILFMPDYKLYNDKKGFLEDYKNIMPGPEVDNFNDFIKLIFLYINKPEKYFDKYKGKISLYLNNYYNKNHNNSTALFANFINKIFLK